MKSPFSIFQILAISKLARGICIVFLPFLLAQNCYYNPFVYDLLNPVIEGEEKAGLFPGSILLALGRQPSSFGISGIIRNSAGAVLTNKELTVTASDSTEAGLDSTGSVDGVGRFYLNLGLGNTTIHVTDFGEDVFTFTLNVTAQGLITVTANDSSEYVVEGLVPYDPNNKPVFFDLISSTPENNETIYTANHNFQLCFSDTLPNWEFSELETIINNNVIVSPSTISFGSPSLFNGNCIIIMATVTVFDIEYTMQIGPGIYSSKGTPVTPTTIRFFTQENAP
ncbi:hypothetical protein [Leptospira jelokensis]|uniref:hypothetical protein n=1 Tax=Leptospira jelokensis TaxID=2484931 RepID=UPI001090CBE3|nr:hypothetical protein [Leptospira jelokensis]TGM05526.1 hypothetical protein EHQ79_05900 [Leptospira jelokensis]